MPSEIVPQEINPDFDQPTYQPDLAEVDDPVADAIIEFTAGAAFIGVGAVLLENDVKIPGIGFTLVGGVIDGIAVSPFISARLSARKERKNNISGE
jgi:hypothetical protein